MALRLGSWNIRGFGAENKKSMIKDLIRSEKLDMLGLIETKHNEIAQWELTKCWGKVQAEYTDVNAKGNSGGLIVTWNRETFDLTNSFATSRWVCLVGSFQQLQLKCAVCVLYAPTEHKDRLKTWDQLRSMKAVIEVPCIIMGDFNEVLEPKERRNSVGYTQGMIELHSLLVDLQLVDMDIGQNFTWFRRNAASRIDRFWIDKEILLQVPNGNVKCKGRVFSDHHPLIFTTEHPPRGPIPFRSLDSWLEEPSFMKTFSKEWLQLTGKPLQQKLKLIKGPLKVWNKEVFGHIDTKITKFQADLQRLEMKAQENDLDDCDLSRMEALKSQLWLWMARKERYWRQLSRCKIIKEGDRNTKFFHLKAKMRQQRNRIDKLWFQGAEINEESKVQEIIISHFKEMYSKQDCTRFDIRTLGLNQLTQSQMEELEQPVSRQEIDLAISSCDPSKAPGYDGFNLKCIKKMWPIIGEDFYSYIQRFFVKGKLHRGFNTTWVTLIPKKKKDKMEISDFRPISLVGSLYKIIAKILSKRLKAVLPGLIGDAQTAFVTGRQILDGALIANEVVHWLKRKKKSGVLLKLDFQKAFDSIDWVSLDVVLEEMGFGHLWRCWIKNCITSASMSVLINGVPSKPFQMERGLRQGDPLSPFLFVLMGEVLNRMMQRAADLNLFKGISVGKNGLQLTHLQFADDTLIFCEADQEHLLKIKNVLLSFQAFSGLMVNFHKSGLIVIGKEANWGQQAADLLGCKLAQLPITYLGVPLGANMRKRASWQCIIDKVHKRLQAWKCSCLSRAGRLVLIKSVLNSLPIYYLSLFRMPKKVAEEIISLQRKFLWGGNKEGRSLSLVRWELVQQSKEKGGLGVGDIEDKNIALLVKWWWKYATTEDQMWKRVIMALHNEDQALLPLCPTKKKPESGIWQTLKQLIQDQKLKAAQAFWENINLVVGKGDRIRFWEDNWTQDKPLKHLFPALYEVSSQKFHTISNMGWFEGAIWKWTLTWQRELTQMELPLLDALSAVLLQNYPKQDEDDNILWQGNNTFSVKELQRSVGQGIEVDNIVCTVWKKIAPPKVEFFMWLALLGKLNTRQRLCEKGILKEDQIECQLCAKHPESLDHILLLCPVSQQIWSSMSAEFGQPFTAATTFKEHYKNWMASSRRKGFNKKIWILSFFATAWNLWQARNELIFQHKEFNHVILIQDIKRKVAFWTKAWKETPSYTEEELARNLGKL